MAAFFVEREYHVQNGAEVNARITRDDATIPVIRKTHRNIRIKRFTE